MNNRCLIALAALAAAATLAPVAAQAKTMKECAAEWDKMKAANQTGGMKYRDFTKQCMSGAAAPVGAAPTTRGKRRRGCDRVPVLPTRSGV
jgi:ABC-type amino acid transport substrate-binding protein